MRILTKEQLKRAEDILTYMYIQNLQEGKGLEDCISMNRKIQWLSKIVLGKKAKDIPAWRTILCAGGFMKTKPKKSEAAHRCCICDNLVGGTPGIDFQIVVNRGDTKYYCDKCTERLRRGE